MIDHRSPQRECVVNSTLLLQHLGKNYMVHFDKRAQVECQIEPKIKLSICTKKKPTPFSCQDY